MDTIATTGKSEGSVTIARLGNNGRVVIETKPKAPQGANIPLRSKDQEIENIKRLLANVSQRLDALKTR